jgi:hypothetical protein
MPDPAEQLMALGAATLGESGGRPMAPGSGLFGLAGGARLRGPLHAETTSPSTYARAAECARGRHRHRG